MTNFFTDGIQPVDRNSIRPGAAPETQAQGVNTLEPAPGLSATIPAGSPAAPAAAGQGGGPKGYATGRSTRNRQTAPVGAVNPSPGTVRAPGAWVGTGEYSPPPGPPPGAGTPPAPAPGLAPADGPYIVYASDSRLPNAQTQVVVIPGTTPPTNTGVLWLDTSGSPVLKYYNGTSWTSDVGLTGATGATGPTGPAGAPPIWRGAWSSGTAYAVNDMVSYNGSSYACLIANTGQNPTTASTPYWLMITAGLNWAGAWSSSTAYQLADLVNYSSSAYIAVDNSTGVTPGTDPTKWQLLIGFGALSVGDIPNLPASKITSGQLALARGGTGADLSATGGAHQFVKQTTAGAALTVGVIASGDLPIASTSAVGVVKADGTTIDVAGDGTLSVIGGGGHKRRLLYMFQCPATSFTGSIDDSQIWILPYGEGNTSLTWEPKKLTLYCSGVSGGSHSVTAQIQKNTAPNVSGPPINITNTLTLTTSSGTGTSTTSFPGGASVGSGEWIMATWTNDLNISNCWCALELEATVNTA
jgi:hypothetical protein